jgi:hypothetical protein
LSSCTRAIPGPSGRNKHAAAAPESTRPAPERLPRNSPQKIKRSCRCRLEEASHQFEWEEIKRDLKALQRVTVEEDGRRLAVRTASTGVCGKVFQAVGVALPPTIREI